MLKRVVMLLLTIPAAVFVVTLAVANRHTVQLILDPFNPENPVIDFPAPLYAFLFGALILGVFLGGMATWMTQSKWRQTARLRTQEAMRWQAEASRLSTERDVKHVAAKQLAGPAGR